MFRKETEFQETEIGEFPKEWKVKKLKEVVIKAKAGGTPRRNISEYWNGNIPFVKIQDITRSGKYLYISEEFITEKGLKNSNAWIVPKDSLLLAIYGSLGSIAINKIPVATNQAIVGIIPNSSIINIEFLYYWFLYFKPYWYKFVKKSTQPNLTLEIVLNSLVPTPPLEEQKRIANILSMIDSSIEIVDRAIAKLERMKRALLNELLTGRIRVREEYGKLTFYRETEFQDSEIGKMPKDWRLVKISNIAEDIYYGITAKAVEHKTSLKMLRTTDIKDYNVDWDSLPFCEITEKRGNIQRFLLKKGDIIIARAGTTGVCVLVEKDFEDVIFGSYLIKVKLNGDVYPGFIYYFCQSHSYWDQITSGQAGSTIKNINLSLLKSLNVPLPSSVKEQIVITETLSTVDKAIELYRREKERLLRLRRSLMSVLLTGRVKVVSDVRDVGVVV
jgi:type I restriction enzyme S subunit